MTEGELKRRVWALPCMVPGDKYVSWTVFVDSEAVFTTTNKDEAYKRRDFERDLIERREIETATFQARHERTRRIYQR